MAPSIKAPNGGTSIERTKVLAERERCMAILTIEVPEKISAALPPLAG